MKNMWILALSFAVIGVGAYGGGLVTVPLIDYELVQNRQLIEEKELSEIVAIAQMTPGPIAVNAATFVGYRVVGVTGALVATAVVVTPAILILIPLGYARNAMDPNYHFVRLRRGLRAGVLSLLFFAVYAYGSIVVTSTVEFAIALGAFAVLTVFEGKVHPLAVIGMGGVVGLVLF